MKQHFGLAAFLCTLLILGTSTVSAFRVSGNEQRWEYKILSFDPSDDNRQIGEKLNQAGQAGWELVTAVRTVFNNAGLAQPSGDPKRITTLRTFVLKRALQ